MNALELKRGDTWSISGTAPSASEGLADLALVECEMLQGNTRHAFTAAITDASARTYKLTMAKSATASMGLGPWQADVEYQDSAGNVVSTETFTIVVLRDITNGS